MTGQIISWEAIYQNILSKLNITIIIFMQTIIERDTDTFINNNNDHKQQTDTAL